MELVDNYTQVFCLHLIYFVFYYKKKWRKIHLIMKYPLSHRNIDK
jgi:hypothetical protein